MGQEVRGVPEAAPLTAEPGGVGHYLASQRRLRGISLDELAGLTKIPRRSLERLESGSFDTSADGFVRGFVRAVAVSLGLDPDEAVMRLMSEPVEAEPSRFGLPDRAWLLRGLLAGFALLVLLGLWLLVSAWLEPAPVVTPDDVFLRRDPVRSLAGESASAPAEAGAADAPAAPADAP